MYGGLPLGGVDFGIAKNCYAMLRHDDQFDFYNGAGVDVTFMGAGQIDQYGNVNATKLGVRPTGAGALSILPQTRNMWCFAPPFQRKV